MNDIIERLRNRIHDAPMPSERLMDDAADEIERLQERLNKIAKHRDTPELIKQYARGDIG